ncbi:hypothetical protein [Aquimarina sediminis]|uniref:hypothetical protein n=1 Tax=Aquimarina sediminis TaxID=2070536 RepID=UPI000C9FFEC9|nr:hypothetical protein [Aquimarina sediminis]
MGKIKNTLFVLICLIAPMLAFGQEKDHSKKHEHENPEMKEPGLEIIVSGLIVYSPKHKIADPANEVHLTYWTSHEWAFGIGYSMIFEEEGRIGHELTGIISHRPWEFLTVNVGPSFSLPNSHKDTEISAYLETEFAFDVGKIHMGPTIGSLIGEEYRLFGGWHISYEF